MGFEPDQRQSRVESVNKFKTRTEAALEEAKAALVKSKDDMAEYYDRRRTPALEYQPGDRVFLDASDIHTTRPSRKLSHRRLSPFPIVKKVGNNAYHLHLPPSMSRLHPVFNVVKLTLAPEDPIPGRRPHPPPLLEIIDGEKEFVVEEILDSKVVNRRLRYLIKWEGYRIEHNSWEPAGDVHAPEHIADFYRRHPGAPRHIRFDAIPFRTSLSAVPRHHSLEGGVDVRGHNLWPPTPEYSRIRTPNKLRHCKTPYVPPHCQRPLDPTQNPTLSSFPNPSLS